MITVAFAVRAGTPNAIKTDRVYRRHAVTKGKWLAIYGPWWDWWTDHAMYTCCTETRAGFAVRPSVSLSATNTAGLMRNIRYFTVQLFNIYCFILFVIAISTAWLQSPNIPLRVRSCTIKLIDKSVTNHDFRPARQ